MAHWGVLLLLLASASCALAKAPENTTQIRVHKQISGSLQPGESIMYWYNARTDSDSLSFTLDYAALPTNDTDFQMLARFSTDESQPPVAEANCSAGSCVIDMAMNITLYDKGNLTWVEIKDPGIPWIIQIALRNTSVLDDQFYTLMVRHNFTRQGLAANTRLITILTAIFGGIATIFAGYALLGILGVFGEEKIPVVSTR